MSKGSFLMESGSISRIILGLVVSLFFVLSAIISSENYYLKLLLVFIGIGGSWREYSLYLLKKKDETDSNPEE